MVTQEDMKGGVLIYGTAAGGEALLQMCQEKGIKVLGFCDDKSVQIGQDFDGVPIVRFLDYVEKYPDAPIFIGIRGVEAIIYRLKKLNVKKWYLCSELLDDVDYSKYEYRSGKSYGIMEVHNTINCHRKYLEENYFFINNLDLVITTKCSLRCRDCCNLMQYYEKPENFAADEVINNLRGLLCYISEINEIRIIGGEPFMHPQLAEITNAAAAEDKIKKISILSNGTIMPSEAEWKAFENDKVILVYTNYGDELSRNLKKIMEVVEERKINCYYRDTEEWTACSEIRPHNRSRDQLCAVMEECCAKHLYTMLGSKIYRCPYLANIHNLGAVDIGSEEVFDIYEYADEIEKGQEKLKEILYKKEYFNSCDYCAGRPYENELITPAIQSKSVLKCPDYRKK